MTGIASTPRPPYYAVIFTSLRTGSDNSFQDNGYEIMAKKMFELASRQVGFLGAESAREDTGITVSYWSDIESIKSWKQNIEHQDAKKKGRELWYSKYKVRIAKVEQDYGI